MEIVGQKRLPASRAHACYPMSMRIAPAAHRAHASRLLEIAPDFELIDAWALPAAGPIDEFSALQDLFTTLRPAALDSGFGRALIVTRRRMGRWFGWDARKNQLPVPGSTETTLVARLPRDLRPSEPPDPDGRGFRLLFRTPNEAAWEISNGTVHAIRHLAWVAQPDRSYRGQLGVYVKPRGVFGRAYMAAIRPFRLYVVYPALLRTIAQSWHARHAN
jgi:hypothetical protein